MAATACAWNQRGPKVPSKPAPRNRARCRRCGDVVESKGDVGALPDFPGDRPEQAVTQCCEDCVRLHVDLLAAERQYRELTDALGRDTISRRDSDQCYSALATLGLPAVAAVLKRHDGERKRSGDPKDFEEVTDEEAK